MNVLGHDSGDIYLNGAFDIFGFDNNGDGIGDTKLPHHGVDHFPLTYREGSQVDDTPLFLTIYLANLIILVIIVVWVLKKRKSKGDSSGGVEGIPPREM